MERFADLLLQAGAYESEMACHEEDVGYRVPLAPTPELEWSRAEPHAAGSRHDGMLTGCFAEKGPHVG